MTANTAHAPVVPIRQLPVPDDEHTGSPINKLRSSVEESFGIHDKLHEEHDQAESTLKRDLSADEYRTKVLERKSKGITRSNAEVAALKNRFNRLVSTIDGPNELDPLIEKKISTELNQINDRLKVLFESLSDDYLIMKGTLDEHTGQLAEHTDQIKNVKDQSDATDRKVAVIDEQVTTIVKGKKFPVIRVVVAVIAGIVACFYWASINFVSTSKPAADGSTITVSYPFANSGWAAIGFGLGIAAILMGIMLMFGLKDKTKTVDVNKTTVWQRITRRMTSGSGQQSSTEPEAPHQETTVTPTASTKVIETTGAESTRS